MHRFGHRATLINLYQESCKCIRFRDERGVEFRRRPVESDQYVFHCGICPRPDSLQLVATLCPPPRLLSQHDAGLGWFNHGDCFRARSSLDHGHPLLPGHLRGQHLRRHPLHSRCLVYGTRTWQAERHLHCIGPCRNSVSRHDQVLSMILALTHSFQALEASFRQASMRAWMVSVELAVGNGSLSVSSNKTQFPCSQWNTHHQN